MTPPAGVDVPGCGRKLELRCVPALLGGDELLFGLLDVRPTIEQLRGNAG